MSSLQIEITQERENVETFQLGIKICQTMLHVRWSIAISSEVLPVEDSVSPCLGELIRFCF